MFDRIEDTIVAISSPPGVGLRGIIRLSGSRAIELAAGSFRCDDGSELAGAGGHERRIGCVRLADDAWVAAEAYTFRAPASYTRQDLVELHMVGSSPALAIVLDDLVARGARPAEPGEFTGRAFLQGAMDLTRVEGVAAIIHAQTDAQLRASEVLLHGALGRKTRQMRDELADLLALVEAEIDFAEEPIEFIPSAEALGLVDRVAASIGELLACGGCTERLEVLARVVLAGLPNAGKSTLFNRLTGLDRAIQSALAGTTRDTIEAPLRLRGGEVMLCDTAGVEASSSPRCSLSDDESDWELQERIRDAAARAMSSADLVLFVVDAADDLQAALARISRLPKGRRAGLVVNKIDRLAGQDEVLSGEHKNEYQWVAYVSATTGEGIDELIEKLAENLLGDADMRGASVMSLSNRQRGSLHEAMDALHLASELFSNFGMSRAELIAMEIRQSIQSLGLLLGDVTSEDVLARIFSRFCIGK